MIVDVYERLGKVDLTRAKGVLSYELDGTKPKISAEADLTLKEARHPVLVLQESKGGHKTIPFDLDLHGKNRMLLISDLMRVANR